MLRKTALALVVALLVTSLSPAPGFSWYSSPPGPYYGGHYGPPRYYYDHGYRYYDHDYDDAWLWVGGILLGTVLVAALLQSTPPRNDVYVQQQTQQIYSYPPYVPPGMCRWERYILDNQGRFVLDQYGQPVKQYTLGSCQFPPN